MGIKLAFRLGGRLGVSHCMARPLKVSKPVAGSRVARGLARQEARAKEVREERKARRAVSVYRPRQSERGSYVFINSVGKRIKAGRGKKGFLVYVTLSKKKQAVKTHYSAVGRNKVIGRPKSISTYKLDRLPRKRAREALLSSGRVEIANGNVRSKALSLGKTGELFKTVALKLVKFGKSKSGKSFIVEITLHGISQQEREPYSVTSEARIDRGDATRMTEEDMIAWLATVFYASHARAAERMGIIGRGSANHWLKIGDEKPIDEADAIVVWKQADWRISKLYFNKLG